MFTSIGWAEIAVLLLAALFIFGPERLPHLARDAAAGLRKVRGAMTGARAGMREALGPEVDDLAALDLRDYHPRALLRRALVEDGDASSNVSPDPALDHLAGGRARVLGERPGAPEGG